MKRLLSVVASAVMLATSTAHAKETLEFNDVFDFKYAKSQQLSENGEVFAFSAKPYRGDAQGQVYSLVNNKLLAKVPMGTKPVINKSADWIAFTVKPSLLESESASKKEKKKLKNSLTIINAKTAKQFEFENVKDFKLSDDGLWLAYRLDKKAEDKKSDNKEEAKDKSKDKSQIKADKKDTSFNLVIVSLKDQTQHTINSIFTYDFSRTSEQMLVSKVVKDGVKNQISLIDLVKDYKTTPLMSEPGIVASQISWHPEQASVAFTAGNYVNDDKRRREYQLYIWHEEQGELTKVATPKSNWFIGKTADISWSEKGERLYFETRPVLAKKVEKKKYKTTEDLTDYATIRDQKGLQIWHNNDAQIKPREQITWNKDDKNRHYQAVYHLDSKTSIQLATPDMNDVNLHKEKLALLGESNNKHLERIMYEGFFADYYAVDVKTGKRKEIISDTRFKPSLSPKGRFAAYFDKGHVQLKNLQTAKLSNLTKGIRNSFADDQHDYPTEIPGYGFAGWMKDGSAVLVYDKYDIWAFDTNSLKATRLTDGEKSNTRYRVIKLDKNHVGFKKGDTVFVKAINLKDKQTEIAKLSLSDNSVIKVLSGKSRFDLIKKAKHADKLLFTQQNYHQFPDIWQTDTEFKK